jgi:hypothetical protein
MIYSLLNSKNKYIISDTKVIINEICPSSSSSSPPPPPPPPSLA